MAVTGGWSDVRDVDDEIKGQFDDSVLSEAVAGEFDGDVESVTLLKYQTKVVAGVMYRLHVGVNGATEATHFVTAYRAPGAAVEIQKTEKA